MGKWGSSGSTNGLFNFSSGFSAVAMGIAVNSAGTTVYVTDGANSRIQYFSGTGAYLGQWGTSGSGNGNFNNPRGLSLNSAGTTVYVADTINNRFQSFDGTGNYLGQWASTSGPPVGVEVNASGTTIVTTELDIINGYSNATSLVMQYGGTGSSNNKFSGSALLAFDTNNHLYIVDSNNNRIQEEAWGSGYVGQWDGSSSGVAFNTPQGVAVDGSNNVYITDYGQNRVVKFGP